MVTQVKNFTFNIPMVGLMALAGSRMDTDNGSSAFVGPMAVALGVLHATPVEFTPLNVLIMHHREE